MDKPHFQAGQVIRFDYPRHNYVGAQPKPELRILRVDSVRDVLEQPLDPMTSVLTPTLCRGRFLVTGMDLNKQEERSFYIERMLSQPEVLDIEDVPPGPLLSADSVRKYQVAALRGRRVVATIDHDVTLDEAAAFAKAYAAASGRQVAIIRSNGGQARGQSRRAL